MSAMQVASLFASLDLKNNMSPGLKTARGDLSNTATAADTTSGRVASMGPIFAAAGAAAAAAFVVQGVASAVQFDKSLRNIQSVTKASNADIGELGKKLLDVGGSSVAGTQAVADAYYDIAGGVADASTHMAILNAAVATSEAGNASLTATTQGMISAMNAYGFSADKAGFVSDVFTQTVGKGVGTMDDFVAAMSPLAGLAASVGIEFDNLGSMMAFMTTKGTNTAQAATQIKAAITSVLNPNKEMQAALKKMGVSSGSAALEMYGLEGTLGRLNVVMGGSDDAMAKALGSTEALQAAVALNNAGYEEFLVTFEDTMGGVTEAARAIQLQSVSAQFDIFKNQIGAFATEIGAALLPALSAIMGGVLKFIDIIRTLKDNWGDTFGGLRREIDTAWAAIKPGLDLITTGIQTMFDVFTTKPQVAGMGAGFGAGMTAMIEGVDGRSFGAKLSQAIQAGMPQVIEGVKSLLQGAKDSARR